MSISGIGSLGSTTSLDPLLAAPAPAPADATDGSATSASVSGLASTLDELGQLQQSDPAKFKEVMGEIGKQLESEAQGATGRKAEFLDALAGKFEQASQTGQMPQLEQPRQASAHHGHHQHAAVQQYGSQQQPSSADAPGTDLAGIIQAALQQAGVTA